MSHHDDVARSNADLYTKRLEARQIRLFRILQPSGKCSFETHNLGEAPKYIAISYTWGPSESKVYADEGVINKEGVPRFLQLNDVHDSGEVGYADSTHILDINGLQFRVSENVHDLVTRMINGGVNERLWIDALCINQADLTERSAQVSMMGDIYQSATNVVVWLGPDEHGEIDTIISMCRAIQAEFWRQLDGDTGRNASVDKMPNLFEPELLQKLGLPPAESDAWWIFARFWDRRWFNRAWVVQEITLADFPRYWWGGQELDSAMLVDVSCFILQSGMPLASRRASKHVPYGTREWFTLRRRIGETLAKIRSFKLTVYSPPGEQHMADAFLLSTYTLAGPESVGGRQRTDCTRLWASMLETGRAWDATDPRDHVYSTLAIINVLATKQELTKPNITVDYSRTVAEVFADVARHIMETGNNVNLLSLAQDPQLRSQRDLPSWVPDFSARGEMPMLFQKALRWKVMPNLYKLAQGLANSSSAFFKVHDDLRTLGVKALRLDKIGDIGESHWELTNGGMWERTAHIILRRSHFVDNEPRIESLWRTLVANASYSGEELATPDMADGFKAFVTISLVMALVHDAEHLERNLTWKSLTDIETQGTAESGGSNAPVPSFEYIRTAANEVGRRFKALEAGGEPHKATPVVSAASKFISAMESMCYRRILVTESGYLGIGPLSAQPEDEIWVLPGAPLATVLRRTARAEGDSNCNGTASYTLLGEAYLHGNPDFGVVGSGTETWEWIELL